MAPQAGAVGTIFFQEDFIFVRSPREDEAAQKGGITPLKLPSLIRSPTSSKTTRRHLSPELYQACNLYHSPAVKSAPLQLPKILNPETDTANVVEASGSPDIVDSAWPASMPAPCPPKQPQRGKPPKRPGKHLRGVAVSKNTLMEVCRVQEAIPSVCRYDGIEQLLDKVTQNRREISDRRREVTKHESALQRQHVRRKRKQKQKHRAQGADEKAALLAREKENERRASMAAERKPSSQTERRTSLVMRVTSTLEADHKVPAKPLGKLRHKLGKQARLHFITQARLHHFSKQREGQLSETRNELFAKMPKKEQELLTAAFKLCHPEKNSENGNQEQEQSTLLVPSHRNIMAPEHKVSTIATERHKSLYTSPLYAGLVELGLPGRGEVEQRDMNSICVGVEAEHFAASDVDFNTFCFDLVPRARARLLELRRENLLQSFTYYDQDGSGFLDYHECMDMCKKMCRNLDTVGHAEVVQEFESLFEEYKEPDEFCGDTLDMEGFLYVFARVQEKSQCVRRMREHAIIDAGEITEELAEIYADELLTLHETFENHDDDGNGTLDSSEVVGALLEHGLVPYDVNQRTRVDSLIRNALSSDCGCMSFSRFLALIKDVREACRRFDKERLKKFFHECDRDGNGLLSFAEAAQMFEKLGLQPYCQDDQDEMKSVLLKVDADNSNDLDFDEFTVLVQHITEMLRANMRRRENASAIGIGFTPHQVAELREIFFHLDQQCIGELDIGDCRRMLTLLRADVSAEVLQEHFTAADSHRTGRIEMEGFLQFIHDISGYENCTHFAPKANREPPSGDEKEDEDAEWSQWGGTKKASVKLKKLGSMLKAQRVSKFVNTVDT